MTSGGNNGTSGLTGDERRAWLTIVAVAVVVALVNTTSVVLEMSRAGLPFDWWEPVLWEGSSAVVVVALAPLVGAAVRRWTPRRDNLIRPGLIHLGLTVPFSLAHVAGITVIRDLVYWLANDRYGFFDDGVGLVLLYEWRKDVLAYAIIAATYWVYQYMTERRALPAPVEIDERIELRDGGAVVFLAPADVLYVEAAGNYIEFHTAARTHLVRGTLASWEARLSQRGFIRVHRSRLVNRARIGAIKPTPSGDVEIMLDDGRTLNGSRRYRAALDAAPTA